jgi:hypothetical protein
VVFWTPAFAGVTKKRRTGRSRNPYDPPLLPSSRVAFGKGRDAFFCTTIVRNHYLYLQKYLRAFCKNQKGLGPIDSLRRNMPNP